MTVWTVSRLVQPLLNLTPEGDAVHGGPTCYGTTESDGPDRRTCREIADIPFPKLRIRRQ